MQNQRIAYFLRLFGYPLGVSAPWRFFLFEVAPLGAIGVSGLQATHYGVESTGQRAVDARGADANLLDYFDLSQSMLNFATHREPVL